VFLLNSRRARFAAAPSGYKPYRGTPSSEVTELICLVPERVFSQAPLDIHLVYLCRFEVRLPHRLLSGFSWQHEITDFTRAKPDRHTPQSGFKPAWWICLPDPPRSAHRRPSGDSAVLLRPRFVITSLVQCRNINRLSIGYAFRPHLRDRLTLSGLTFLRKP
jgi:hypothetical protein